MKKPGLTNGQRKFVQEYVKDWNGTQAAIRAGYAPKNAAITATKLLINPNIQIYFREIQRKSEDESVLTLLEAKKIATDLARNGKPEQQLAAIDRLAKFNSWDQPQRHEVAAVQKIDLSTMTDDQLKRLLREENYGLLSET